MGANNEKQAANNGLYNYATDPFMEQLQQQFPGQKINMLPPTQLGVGDVKGSQMQPSAVAQAMSGQMGNMSGGVVPLSFSGLSGFNNGLDTMGGMGSFGGMNSLNSGYSNFGSLGGISGMSPFGSMSPTFNYNTAGNNSYSSTQQPSSYQYPQTSGVYAPQISFSTATPAQQPQQQQQQQASYGTYTVPRQSAQAQFFQPKVRNPYGSYNGGRVRRQQQQQQQTSVPALPGPSMMDNGTSSFR
ncbi:hypothetical protein SNEBB_009264 [Seison nebaliae]|nr:hypothetical protein SNEBB_009264 [Seison nebaliae]